MEATSARSQALEPEHWETNVLCVESVDPRHYDTYSA